MRRILTIYEGPAVGLYIPKNFNEFMDQFKGVAISEHKESNLVYIYDIKPMKVKVEYNKDGNNAMVIASGDKQNKNISNVEKIIIKEAEKYTI